MSVGAHSIGEQPVAAQVDKDIGGRGTPPRKRTVIAQSDTVAQPEAR
jgi:hypothetical protein